MDRCRWSPRIGRTPWRGARPKQPDMPMHRRGRTRARRAWADREPGEDPGAMPPGVQGVLAEPPPDRGAADRSHQPGTDHLPLQLRQGEPGQGLPETVRQFTRERFNGDDDSGGKSVRGTRHAAVHRGPEDVARKSVCATWIRFDAAYRDVRQ